MHSMHCVLPTLTIKSFFKYLRVSSHNLNVFTAKKAITARSWEAGKLSRSSHLHIFSTSYPHPPYAGIYDPYSCHYCSVSELLSKKAQGGFIRHGTIRHYGESRGKVNVFRFIQSNLGFLVYLQLPGHVAYLQSKELNSCFPGRKLLSNYPRKKNDT